MSDVPDVTVEVTASDEEESHQVVDENPTDEVPTVVEHASGDTDRWIDNEAAHADLDKRVSVLESRQWETPSREDVQVIAESVAEEVVSEVTEELAEDILEDEVLAVDEGEAIELENDVEPIPEGEPESVDESGWFDFGKRKRA